MESRNDRRRLPPYGPQHMPRSMHVRCSLDLFLLNVKHPGELPTDPDTLSRHLWWIRYSKLRQRLESPKVAGESL